MSSRRTWNNNIPSAAALSAHAISHIISCAVRCDVCITALSLWCTVFFIAQYYALTVSLCLRSVQSAVCFTVAHSVLRTDCFTVPRAVQVAVCFTVFQRTVRQIESEPDLKRGILRGRHIQRAIAYYSALFPVPRFIRSDSPVLRIALISCPSLTAAHCLMSSCV